MCKKNVSGHYYAIPASTKNVLMAKQKEPSDIESRFNLFVNLISSILSNLDNFAIKVNTDRFCGNGMLPNAFSIENFSDFEQKKNLAKLLDYFKLYQLPLGKSNKDINMKLLMLKTLLENDTCTIQILEFCGVEEDLTELAEEITEIIDTLRWNEEKVYEIIQFAMNNDMYDNENEELDLMGSSKSVLNKLKDLVDVDIDVNLYNAKEFFSVYPTMEKELLTGFQTASSNEFKGKSVKHRNAAARHIGEKKLDCSLYSLETLIKLNEFKFIEKEEEEELPKKKKQKQLSHFDLENLAKQTMNNTNDALQQLHDELRRLGHKIVDRDHAPAKEYNEYNIDVTDLKRKLEEEEEDLSSDTVSSSDEDGSVAANIEYYKKIKKNG